MPSVGVLIFFAILGALICARARTAGGSVVFSLIALVLFISTPAGAGLPGMVADFVSAVGEAAGPLTDGSEAEG